MKDVMNVVFLGLGGNQGDRLANLTKSTNAIEKACGKIVLRSKIYETAAWGLSSSLLFLNQVIKIETKHSVEELHLRLMKIEETLGRKRGDSGYSDRTVDVDILFFNEEIIDTSSLQIPHPRLHLRKFVLIPLNEIAREFVHPTLRKNINQLLESCTDKLDVRGYQV